MSKKETKGRLGQPNPDNQRKMSDSDRQKLNSYDALTLIGATASLIDIHYFSPLTTEDERGVVYPILEKYNKAIRKLAIQDAKLSTIQLLDNLAQKGFEISAQDIEDIIEETRIAISADFNTQLAQQNIPAEA